MTSLVFVWPLVARLTRLSVGRWGVGVAVGAVVAWSLTAAAIHRWMRRAP